MAKKLQPPLKLSSAADVEQKTNGSYAVSAEVPWLRIECDGSALANRWVRLSYRSSLLDPLVRPVLRCFTADSYWDEILPGALFGRSVWIGHIPPGVRELWISPTNRPDPFNFILEALAPIATAELIWQCFRRNPHRCLTGIGARIIGLRYAAKTEFRRVLSATPIGDYDIWRKRRIRELDVDAMDRPRTEWANGPHIRLVVSGAGKEAPSTALKSLTAQLQQQPYPHWTLVAVSPLAEGPFDLANLDIDERRVWSVSSDASATDLVSDLSDQDIIVPLSATDLIPSYALAALVAAAQRDISTEIFYGDADSVDSNGRYAAPKFLPDWSPILFAHRPSLATAVFFRARKLKPYFQNRRAEDCSIESMVSHAFLTNPVVSHIRRIMRTCLRVASAPDTGHHKVETKAYHKRATVALPHATIIVPTKNKPDLLKRCVEGLRMSTPPREIEVIVVDNGSTEEEACCFLATLERDARFRVLSYPGPFNFPKICNDAAAEAHANVLIFLNNDTEIVQNDWLEPLLYWAEQPDVGAVGAKLLYPDRRLQHGGIILGIDGLAGHFDRMLPESDPGYFGRLCVPHEVSAVTAACLAVEKRKFDRVNGFDALNLPVELNDADLCLRLEEEGWKSLCVPDSILVHHESASRGRTYRPDEIYRREHVYFRHRWINWLRDDPYFHPALSLDALGPALG